MKNIEWNMLMKEFRGYHRIENVKRKIVKNCQNLVFVR